MGAAPTPERIVVVGAGLAGLRGAEAIRAAGFRGALTIVGAEPHRPYDRPPLSKHVLTGQIPAEASQLPSRLGRDVTWRLGVDVRRLDREGRQLHLSDGGSLPYDRLLIATGTRARPWIHADEAALRNVFTIRTREDAAGLRAALVAKPKRVLVIGAGFIGCEVAAVCRELDLPVSLIDPSPSPLARVLGHTVGAYIGEIHRGRGVAMRFGSEVAHLEGANDRVTGARLKDGEVLEAEVVVIALGAVRNTEWLDGSGLSADGGGVDCDARGFVLDEGLRPDPSIAAAGDVARFPHPLYGGRRVALEHWGHAVAQADHAGRLLAGADTPAAYAALPNFWSVQGDMVVKSVGLTDGADAVAIVQGDPAQRRFIAVYGRAGRCVAALAVDSARWLPAYAESVASAAPFPPAGAATDRPLREIEIREPGFA
ncbi:NAD(P)/FAD-dependent oxidoreductase [Methylobacterium sp. J-076]|uniref:NAD(P)/FAD-dependent oxidoreductase n=1 Tax=Methylobacterium sp. J-076 TaxID=2836655 RepID=UPI001FBBDAEB|nr:FAD-dependent oxidoreductase [Methylobacterium sp. J-076]MCJ2012945.1 FAD-dependent oxidoreductase [Methylobacterium sp. J-076]